MARVRRADCSEPGFTRVRSGRGFRYVDASGETVRDEETLERVRALAIPPAWTDVWICMDPLGHIQATGFDDAGRKQYRYHDRWRDRQDRRKFDEMLELAALLPSLRRRLRKRLGERGLTRERVLAGAVLLLDLGFFRIGGEEYAEQNESFGLATIRKSHVRSENGAVVFDYPAKSSQRRVQEITDPELVRLVRALKQRRGGGRELLAYRGDDGRWVDVRSTDVNAHLRKLTRADLSAKDFRTWNATVLAAVQLAAHDGEGTTKTARKRIARQVVKEVAALIGNTPAVCRRSYIDPRIFDRFDSGATIREELGRHAGRDLDALPAAARDRVEAAVIGLLRD